jgi:DNA double-strand break repair helicase HerA and related ATPase
VLGQLGNRVQHALRAFTPRDQKAVRAAAETFRPNPAVDVAGAIGELAVGEALVSFLDAKGSPAPVQRARVYPPRSRLRPLTPEERAEVVRASGLQDHYGTPVDRESAYEKLRARADGAQPAPGEGAPRGGGGRAAPRGGGDAMDVLQSVAKSAARAAGTQLGREIMRGVFGSIFGGRRR